VATLIRGMAMEDMVAEVINRFCYLYPAQTDNLKRLMSNMRSIQRHATGTGDECGYIGEIPVELWAMMTANIGPHWRHDPEIRNTFWRLFRIGRVNQHNPHAGDSDK
jgi:hypothetical protein